MTRGPGPDMLGVMDAVHDQLTDVIAGKLVKDLGTLAARRDESGHPQLREMLGDRGLGFADPLSQLQHGRFSVEQQPEQTEAGRIGQHSEDLDG